MDNRIAQQKVAESQEPRRVDWDSFELGLRAGIVVFALFWYFGGKL